ncbi:Astacin (Peptidase M12A) [Parelaphostrongylus tenuis]|uniref:Metalloendopeptidase n=1 Tax=Parelaphostrongylus tenuis TaxID=148309 RepID=A0AAD5RE64_PARTN|nr:Astacin (Peptidase M12A) [Parelaphostrongylus tenuis]
MSAEVFYGSMLRTQRSIVGNEAGCEEPSARAANNISNNRGQADAISFNVTHGETERMKRQVHPVDKVVIYDSLGCATHIGKIGRNQSLYLGQNCDTIHRTAHELGHTLGFSHTHSRPDRDEHITIIRKNIRDDLLPEFNKSDIRTMNTYNLPYDYALQRTMKIVMRPRPDDRYLQTIGSPMISFYDKLAVNLHYKCLGCGKTVYAKTWFQTLVDSVGRENYNPYDHNDEFIMCNYWIVAPTGSTIEVKLEGYSKDGYSDGCKDSGVEIKIGNDTRSTGYR